MFPSPPNFHNPFESLLKTSSSLSSHENPFNFPSPFLDEHESPLNQIFSQNSNKIDTNNNITHHDPTKRINLGKSKVEAPPRGLGVVPRRRAGKKDRHSKICTAQGIRDRRMRLSLQVARKFFDLQDMLGYDKASKTIEWLFTQSKEAINELIDESHHLSPAKSESFVSECEEMSGIEETNSSNVVPNSSKSNSKESRDKARERARCRTREKMLVKFLSGDCYKPNPNFDKTTIEKLGSSNQDQDQEKSHNFEGIRVSPFESAYNSIEQQFSDYHSTAADYADPNNSSLMGFLGNWDERTNLFHYSVMNQVSYAGNLNSVFSEFP